MDKQEALDMADRWESALEECKKKVRNEGAEMWVSGFVAGLRQLAPQKTHTDSELLDWWGAHPEYVVGLAPSGDWSAFNKHGATCYDPTLRGCLSVLQVMHADVNGKAHKHRCMRCGKEFDCQTPGLCVAGYNVLPTIVDKDGNTTEHC